MTRKRKEERWRQPTRELNDADVDVDGMGAASLLVAGSDAGG